MPSPLQDAIASAPPAAWATAACLLALLALLIGRRTAPKTVIRRNRRKPRDEKARRSLIGFTGMALVVAAGFALSASTSFVFAEKRLHFTGPWITTAGLVLEAIVLGLTVYSWAFQDKGTARAAYLLVFAQAIGAVEVAQFQHEDLGTAGVRIVGPVMLAYGLHKLLGLETKLNKIEIKSNGMLARAWRHFLKWLESFLGISEREANAEAIRRKRAQDKLIALSTLGKPRFMRQSKYHRLLMQYGDAAFSGIGNPLDELEIETRITTRKDRAEAFKNLPNRKATYQLHSLRSSFDQWGAPDEVTTDTDALTSEGAPGRTPGPTESAPGAHPGEARARPRPAESEAELIRRAFELYCRIRDDSGKTSQNAFEKAWRDAGYGLKTDDIRVLYKNIDSKINGKNKGTGTTA